MLTLRLARAGTKKRPVYHLVAADQRARRDGRFVENLGYYIPAKEVLVVKQDRIDYWLSVGARTSDTVKSLIKKARAEGNTVPVVKPKYEAPPVKIVEPEAKADAKDAKAAPKADAKGAPKADAKAEPKADAKAEPKADAKGAPKADAKAAPKADAKAAPKADAKAAPKADAKAEPKADAKAEPKAEAKAPKAAEAKAEDAPAAAKTDDAAPAAGDGETKK